MTVTLDDARSVTRPGGMRGAIKGALHALSMALMSPLALSSWVERVVSARDEAFVFWAQALALVPGLLGVYLRRGFYAWTLRACAPDCVVSFLAVVNDRRAEIGPRASLGAFTTVGHVRVGAGCQVASRVSLLSGSRQHAFTPEGDLTTFERAQDAALITIGPNTWVGEGALVMADVGARCIVGAGSVVSQPVPDRSLVAGNPARVVRRLD